MRDQGHRGYGGVSVDAALLGVLLDELAPGVWGYTTATPDALYIPIIQAETPGSGDVGRYLDSLPSDRTIRVPNVLSDILAAMLARRGFVEGSEWSSEFGEQVRVWERQARKGKPDE